LKAQLDTATAAFSDKVAELDKRLLPLQRAMDDAYDVWLRACKALESQRISNQNEVTPLQEKVHALIATINKPLHADRVKQWGLAEPGSFPMPRPDLG
jgi:phosphate uptake regulator